MCVIAMRAGKYLHLLVFTLESVGHIQTAYVSTKS